jgi:hypothetical protein
VNTWVFLLDAQARTAFFFLSQARADLN